MKYAVSSAFCQTRKFGSFKNQVQKMKEAEIKSRHHYVWAHYLKRWGNGTSDVYYSTKRLKVAHDSVKAIAFDFHFYRSTKLSQFDIEVIKGFSKPSPPELRGLHEQALNKFLEVQATKELYESLGLKIPEVESAFEAANANSLENMHAAIEFDALPIIDQLANGNLEILKDTKHAIVFFNFFGHQVTRTKSFKDKAILILSRNTELEKAVAESMENAWWFLSYMYGLNLGKSLFESRNLSRVSLLKNNTTIPFITADQPIINVHKCVLEDEITPPEQGDFFILYRLLWVLSFLTLIALRAEFLKLTKQL